MANLNDGIKVMEMVSGEVTEIMHEGEVFTKIVGEQKEGDIGLRVSEHIGDIVHVGSYYLIAHKDGDYGSQGYFDEDGTYVTTGNPANFEYFRKAVTKSVRVTKCLDGHKNVGFGLCGQGTVKPGAVGVVVEEGEHDGVKGVFVKFDDSQPSVSAHKSDREYFFLREGEYEMVGEVTREVAPEVKPESEFIEVDRDAKPGDFIKFNVVHEDYVSEYKYYEVVRLDSCDDPQIIDDDGDEYDLYEDDYDVFEKVGAKPKLEVGDKVRLLSGGDTYPLYGYNNGEVYEVSDAARDHDHYDELCIAISGGSYTNGYALPNMLEKVGVEPVPTPTKALMVGDLIVPLESADCYGITNTEMKLAKVTEVSGDEIDIEVLAHEDSEEVDSTPYAVEAKHFRKATDEEIAAVGEPADSKISVGDYVKVISGHNGHSEPGDIVKVSSGGIANGFNVEHLDGTEGGYKFPERVTKATADEIAEAMGTGDLAPGTKVQVDFADKIYTIKERKPSADDTRYSGKAYSMEGGGWLAESQFEVISEEVEPAKRAKGEIRNGDIVRVKKSTGFVPVGTLGEVADANEDDFRVNTVERQKANWHTSYAVELVARVEDLA